MDNFFSDRKITKQSIFSVFLFRKCCLLLIMMILSQFIYAQTSLLNLRLNDVAIEEVINKIEEQSDYHFLYNKKMVDVTTKTSIIVQNESIINVLDKLFQHTDIS